ncbi:hypothetical protein BGX21_011623 [Mortierella sp. AD011]|nr:hypothetical protein BGX20_000511 [Mortierella sp. AD010]KAF9401985.1 hypothetical protein BGX21_011623 [Mortierella sp. AD011]
MAISKAMHQIILIGIICSGTIGMFNAMSSIGNAGRHSPTAQNLAITSSSIAYIIGFLLAGATHNLIGPRLCVLLGGISFVLYAGSMMLASDNDHSIYPPLAGILLGIGAGLIWVTQGAMMMSYPTENNKGKYISCFWALYNIGAVLGSILPLVMNLEPDMDPDDVSSLTYVVYMAVMGAATFLALFLSRPSSISRDDGEPVNVEKFAGLKAEGLAILSVFCDWRMLLLIPAFFFSNFSYTYQFNDFNGFTFNIRTRSLNSIIFWVAQIIGALLIGYLLDRMPVRRPKRAMIGLLIVALLFMATWIAALIVQLKHRWERRVLHRNELIDYGHGSYVGLGFIYGMFGFCDAAFAVFCYWLMGALSNKYDELSRYAGFFKSIQSLGSAVAAPLDLAQTPFQAYLITNWIICALSIAAMFLVCRTVTDTTLEYEGDDNEEEPEYYDEEMDDSSYDTSVDEHDENGQNHVSGKHTDSPERDKSTVCATGEVEEKLYGSQLGAQSSSCWRSSRTTSGTQEDYIEEQGGSQSQSKSSHSFLEPGERISYSSSSASVASNMAYPPRVYQDQHQYYAQQPSDRSIHRSGGISTMTEVPHDLSAGLGPAYWMDHSLSTIGTQQAFYPKSQSSIPEPSTSTPLSDTNASYQPGSSASTSHFISAPTFMISDENSIPMPLYASQPELFYHYSQWLAEGQAITAEAEIQEEVAEGTGNLPVAPEFLQPHNQFHPIAHTASSAGSTRYDDEQDMDMDSTDTHSISSMSSGHDSIPEMTEM